MAQSRRSNLVAFNTTGERDRLGTTNSNWPPLLQTLPRTDHVSVDHSRTSVASQFDWIWLDICLRKSKSRGKECLVPHHTSTPSLLILF